MVVAAGPVRIVLVDDHEMVIEGLKAMLAAFSERVQVVGQAVGAERALSVIDELQPDIVLCDVRMQGSSGLDLCQELRERDPRRKVARAVDTAARMQRHEFWPGARQGLTQRESEILSFVVGGLSNRAIATKLVIGDETVKSHLRSIYRKLGVSDRAGAVATALREGIYK